MIATEAIAKSYGATRALVSCSFSLAPGEVHAIVGENGSGKSTLVKILTGLQRPDAGTMRLDGEIFAGFHSPRAAMDAGVTAVFQEVLVAGPRSVLENVWLGGGSLVRHRLGVHEKRALARSVLDELLGAAPDLDVAVEELSLSDRQACCIARALVRAPRILILDEATSALDVATRDRLFSILRRRAAEEQTSVIFISHRMDEVEEIGERITVMRSGVTVGTVARGEASVAELVTLMTGETRSSQRMRRTCSPPHGSSVVLRARGLRLATDARPIDFELRAGELVGLAGLEGQGQDAFLQVLRGGPRLAGEVIRVEGEVSSALRSPTDAYRHGVAYVPQERRGQALFETKSVRENFALPTLGRDVRLGLINDRATERRLATYVERLGIKLSHSGALITTLSGGNQQKIVMARWLAATPRVLLLNDPTRGVDLGAKRDIYDLLVELSDEGIATVMLSTEVDEHVELMDRVLVFRERELAAQISRDDLSNRALVSAFFGQTAAEVLS